MNTNEIVIVLSDHVANSIPHAIPVDTLSAQECQASGVNTYSAVCGRTVGDACDADAGSALACTRGNGKYLLKGIYSAETGCGSNQVVTFTKMDANFINSNKNGGSVRTPSPNTPQLYRVPSTQAPSYLPPNRK